jgi:hypothetical protein
MINHPYLQTQTAKQNKLQPSMRLPFASTKAPKLLVLRGLPPKAKQASTMPSCPDLLVDHQAASSLPFCRKADEQVN